jgi:hypothetical protein
VEEERTTPNGLSRTDIVKDVDGEPHLYMRRWSLRTPWCTLRLHHIVLDDVDRALHDHPWSFLSVVLKGAYDEERPGATHRRRAGSIAVRRATDLHRVTLASPAVWTFVVTGRHRRTWGFVTDEGWVPWHEYSGAGSRRVVART